MGLKDPADLELSPVVANNAMNRLRVLTGPNGYATDLGFDVAAWLAERLAARERVTWVDLCCGAARALDEASCSFDADPATRGRLTIVGVDLAAAHDRRSPAPGLQIVEANVERWTPDGPVDLVTCVHGLHYVGDKLGLVTRALGWLAPAGRFAANLDLANVKVDGRPGSRAVLPTLRAARVTWDGRRRLLRADGPRQLAFDLEYRGADDGAGPNATGQPAVDSHYTRAARSPRG
jgi:hypothetical protein